MKIRKRRIPARRKSKEPENRPVSAGLFIEAV